MEDPFAALAEALDDLVRFERHRIELETWLSTTFPGAHYQPGAVLATWQARLARLEAAAKLLTALAPHEAAVRALAGLPAAAGTGVNRVGTATP